jgi:intein/homing endonuclease
MKNFESIDKQAIEMYQKGLSLTKIARELKVDRGSLTTRIKDRIDIVQNNKKYIVDDNYFKKIIDEHKAYWLGFLMADGNLCKHEKRPMIELGVSEVDSSHLNKFASCIKSNTAIYKRKHTLNEKIYYSSRIMIYSKPMYEDLIRHGCVPNKTFNMKFPQHIDKQLIKHYIRGYFDGDGCIHYGASVKSKVGKISFSSGCEDFLKDVQIIISELVGINFTLSKERTCYSLKTSKQNNILIFLDYIYKDSLIYLNRKYEKCKSLSLKCR